MTPVPAQTFLSALADSAPLSCDHDRRLNGKSVSQAPRQLVEVFTQAVVFTFEINPEFDITQGI
jgi:hypothetical protein